MVKPQDRCFTEIRDLKGRAEGAAVLNFCKALVCGLHM